MINYSPQTAPAIGFLKSSLNDIEIYVEDTSKSYMWLALVRSCLPRNIKISSVTPLGGRDAVEAACAADQGASSRRRLYLIDADFDYVLGRGRRRLNHLYRIPAYCIEGLIFDEARILGLVSDLRPDLAPGAETAFRQYFVTTWGPRLRKLSMRYAASWLAEGHELTSGYHVGRLGSNQGGSFVCDEPLIRDRCDVVMTDIRGRKRIKTSKLRTIADNARSLPVKKVISGKTYLIVLLQRWLRSFADADINLDVLFGMLLSKGCPDPQLRRRLGAC